LSIIVAKKWIKLLYKNQKGMNEKFIKLENVNLPFDRLIRMATQNK
jgi:hypothetical protein